MTSLDHQISRSPTPPEPDDDGEEWPVHGIVGEDIDVFGISRYEHTLSHLLRFKFTPPSSNHFSQLRGKLRPSLSLTPSFRIDDRLLYTKIRWKNWSRPDGTNTTWMREIEDDPVLVPSWNEAMRYQRLRKASESQSIDLVSLASTPMHDRLTFESAQAVEEKMAERLRKGPPGKVYQGWTAEIERKVAHHERRGERKPPTTAVSRKRIREPSPSLGGCVWNLSSSRWAPFLTCQPGERLMPKARAQVHRGSPGFLWY